MCVWMCVREGGEVKVVQEGGGQAERNSITFSGCRFIVVSLTYIE